MMKKVNFKFELGQKVFWLGHQGLCIVVGRGVMNFLNGGECNWYALDGAHCYTLPEYDLSTIQEFLDFQRLSNEKTS